MHPHDDGEHTGVFTLPGLEPAPRESDVDYIAERYRVEERIGEGAMGQVFRVAHHRLEKPFALKLMKPELSLDLAARKIFHREARLASSLSHPNIVSIVDFGEDRGRGLYLVMEYLDGDTLSRRIDTRGKLPLNVACDVATQLGEALHHSHQRNIVHADLKSENILCVTDPNNRRRHWRIKLLDFGMANIASASGGVADQVAGTPEYLAPERIRGEPPLPSVDIYAFGIILYEMLTGVVPFYGGTPQQIMRRHLTEEPLPLTARRGEPVDPALEAIVQRALAKDPAARYPDTGALVADLHAYMHELGLRRRTGEIVALTPSESQRQVFAAATFDTLAVPAAALRADGTIVVANSALGRLLRRPPRELESRSAFSTDLPKYHPGLREDLRLVAIDGKVVRRRLTLRRSTGDEMRMRLVMTPGHGDAGDCTLVLHALPTLSKE